MSRHMSPSAGKLFSLVIFLGLVLFFFVINLSAQQFSPIPQALFAEVHSKQDQVKKSQSQQIQAEKNQAPQNEKQTQAPRQVHFYNVDSERKIEGTIQEILLEPRYEERQPFLMIVIKEKTTGEIYKVEVSPAWFFNYDLHKGEAIKIVGSYYSQNNENYLIARELQVGGETFRVRDRRGFPNWRGGPMKGKVRRIRGK